MALIDCPECSHKISDQSTSCPSCGFVTSKINKPKVENLVRDPKPKKHNKGYKQASFKQVMIVLIGGFLFFYFFIKSDNNESLQASLAESDTPSQSEIQIETTAEEMIKTYEANEAKGDAIYKDKTIKIVGIVDSISSDFSDKAVVMLSSGKDKYSFNNIHASGDEQFHNQAINLNKGNKITLICTGNGEAIGSPFLKNCVFS